MKMYRLIKQESKPMLLYMELKQTPPVATNSETLTQAKIANFIFLHDPTKVSVLPCNNGMGSTYVTSPTV